MPLIGRGSFFTFNLHNCRKWQTLPDLIMALESIQDDFGLIALQAKPVDDGIEKRRLPIRRRDFASYCEANYHVRENWDRENLLAALSEGRLYLHLRPPFLDEVQSNKDLLIVMTSRKFGSDYNYIHFSTILSARTVPKSELTSKYGERLMQLYVTMSPDLIRLLAPDYVWISEDDEYADHVGGRDILARRFNVIYWANYFGPGYLDEHTQRVFLNAPVGIARRLEGGIWYQLHENFETVDSKAVEHIEGQVMSYFSGLNLDRVQWRYRAG